MLDEATSALDNIRERHVQSALAIARQERTVIVVAHRLSTLLDTDRILVFDKGRIVESGTYDGLVDAGGVFTGLLRCAQPLGTSHGFDFATGRASGHSAAPGGGRGFRPPRPSYTRPPRPL